VALQTIYQILHKSLAVVAWFYAAFHLMSPHTVQLENSILYPKVKLSAYPMNPPRLDLAFVPSHHTHN
jgi:hypothetical protein